jgi:hypothetical protein
MEDEARWLVECEVLLLRSYVGRFCGLALRNSARCLTWRRRREGDMAKTEGHLEELHEKESIFASRPRASS